MSRSVWAMSAGSRQAYFLDKEAQDAKLKKVRAAMELRAICAKMNAKNVNSKKF